MSMKQDQRAGARVGVVLTGGFLTPEVRARLAARFAVTAADPAEVKRAGTEWERAQGLRVEGLITTGHAGADGALMDCFPALKVAACYGVGYDGIDVAAATARGVWVTNTPDVLNEDVADLALALMLAVVRRLPEAERYARAGRWETDGDFPLTARLFGRRLGMLGMGRIGGAIVRRALAFGMEVSYHATAPKPDSPHRWTASPRELAAAADVLCLAAPATPATTGMVDGEVLRALGKGRGEGYLVNIARGSLVDEPALITALRDGVIAGAALDVFADEPRIPPELRAMENVALSPHQGSATVHTRRAMGELAAENVTRVLNGEAPKTPVNNPATTDE